jgi:aminoglycoside phosphotransferase (APT) family kinase protein
VLDRRRAPATSEFVRLALGALPAEGYASPPTSWVVQRRLARDPDMVVVAVGPLGGPPRAIVKLADGALAGRQLAHEHAVLRELRSSEAPENWRRLVPEPLAGGDVGSRPYLAVSVLPGTDARRLLRRRGEARLTRTAAGAIAVLARSSGESTVVDDEQLSRWVGEPAAVIARTTRVGTRSRLQDALRRVDDELRCVLAGRRLATGWGHGDYWLGNVLVSPHGDETTGIVDWERAAAGDLAVLDTVQLLVTTRALVRRRELGSIVRELAAGSGWSAHEERLLDTLREELCDDRVSTRDLVLLAWLRHVANNLSKRAGYAGHRIWLRNNVVAVLDLFDA